jgi:hypothetical protein
VCPVFPQIQYSVQASQEEDEKGYLIENFFLFSHCSHFSRLFLVLTALSSLAYFFFLTALTSLAYFLFSLLSLLLLISFFSLLSLLSLISCSHCSLSSLAYFFFLSVLSSLAYFFFLTALTFFFRVQKSR